MEHKTLTHNTHPIYDAIPYSLEVYQFHADVLLIIFCI